jgi:hypothetical protein
MGNTISQSDREIIWVLFSDAFIDTEINYHQMVCGMNKFPRAELKNIFFEEVSPVCGHNLLAPIPTIWSGFSPEWVKQEIKKSLEKQSISIFYRILHALTVIVFRRIFKKIWHEIDGALDNLPVCKES